MTLTPASLFFTPQAGAPGIGQSPVPGIGGLLAVPPGGGGNFMDMIFARILRETAVNEGTEGGNGILSLLAPAHNGKEAAPGKLQHVQLNEILHKIAHEVSATIPDTDVPQDTPGEAGDAPADMLAALQSLIGQLQKTSADSESIPSDAAPESSAEPVPPAVTDAPLPLPEPTRRNFLEFLGSLLQGIPEESRPVVINIAPGLLHRAVKNLEFDPAAAMPAPVDAPPAPVTEGGETPAPAPALIATGLTPESLTEFIDELSQRLQQGESFIVGMVKILPPQAKREVIFLPRALVLSGQALPQANKPEDGTTIPQDRIPADESDAELPQPVALAETPAMPEVFPPQKKEHPLLALLAAMQAEQPARPVSPAGEGKKNDGTDGKKFAMPALLPDESGTDDRGMPPVSREIVARLNALATGGELPAPDSGMPEEAGFARVLKVLEEARARNADKNPAGLDKAINVIKSMSPALSTFHGHGAFPAMGMAFAAALSGDIFPDGWDWSKFSGQAGQAMTMNSPAMLASSLVNQAPHATNPHPATQIVAATITKAAATGENRNITVKLEPPELGRVEIRMDFGKEKSVKTHIIIEKHETYLMLQRDAHILDRTLQDSGLDTDGGVSFELAQDGNGFDDGGDRQRGASGGGDSGTGTENAEEIIEATMDWYVDPDTGLTRYDIMA